jgi:hypothetical protein
VPSRKWQEATIQSEENSKPIRPPSKKSVASRMHPVAAPSGTLLMNDKQGADDSSIPTPAPSPPRALIPPRDPAPPDVCNVHGPACKLDGDLCQVDQFTWINPATGEQDIRRWEDLPTRIGKLGNPRPDFESIGMETCIRTDPKSGLPKEVLVRRRAERPDTAAYWCDLWVGDIAHRCGFIELAEMCLALQRARAANDVHKATVRVSNAKTNLDTAGLKLLKSKDHDSIAGLNQKTSWDLILSEAKIQRQEIREVKKYQMVASAIMADHCEIFVQNGGACPEVEDCLTDGNTNIDTQDGDFADDLGEEAGESQWWEKEYLANPWSLDTHLGWMASTERMVIEQYSAGPDQATSQGHESVIRSSIDRAQDSVLLPGISDADMMDID